MNIEEFLKTSKKTKTEESKGENMNTTKKEEQLSPLEYLAKKQGEPNYLLKSIIKTKKG